MYLNSFSVQGYRSFQNLVKLEQLGRIVVIYGLNDAGKTNLLRALALFTSLIQKSLLQLMDDIPRNQDAVYHKLKEDPWMFCLEADAEIFLEGGFKSDNHSVLIGFAIVRSEYGIACKLTKWREGSQDCYSNARDAYDTFKAIQDSASEEDNVATEAWQAHIQQWEAMQKQLPGITLCDAAKVPVPCKIRSEFAGLLKSLDIQRRNQAKRMLARFGEAAESLPSGSLELVDTPAMDDDPGGCPDDFGWIMDTGVIPLDILGTGAQALFSMLATLGLANTRIVAFEEPESHLNALLQMSLGAMLQEEITASIGISQIWIVTHSTAFAHPDFKFDLRLIERKDSETAINQVQPFALQPYATPKPEGKSQNNLPPSLLGYDGSVQLPPFVINGLNIQSGQFVYFVESGQAEFQIVSEERMRNVLGDNE